MKEKLKEFGETNDEQVRFMKERIEYMKTSKTGKLSDADENKLEEVLKVVEETNPAQKNVIDFNVTRKKHELNPEGSIDMRVFLSFSTLKICQS